MYKQRHDSSLGMTLIELIVVMTIVGIIMGVCFTSLDGLTPSSRLGAAAREISSTIILAKCGAALNGKNTKVLYNLDKGIYQVIFPPKRPKGKARIYSRRHLPKHVRFKDIIIGINKVVRSGKVLARFTPTGLASSHAVHLINENQQQMTVLVNPLTGIVSLYEGYRKPDVVEKLR